MSKKEDWAHEGTSEVSATSVVFMVTNEGQAYVIGIAEVPIPLGPGQAVEIILTREGIRLCPPSGKLN